MVPDALREELLQGLAYYKEWEDEERHTEEVERQRFIRSEVEDDGRYAILAYNGELLALGKLVALQHPRAWLEHHVLPQLDAPVTLKDQAAAGELMMPEIALELSKLEEEVTFWRRSANEWRSNHASEVAAKRRLSVKYGAIMARKPAARLRRTKKRIKRCVTRVTHNPGGLW